MPTVLQILDPSGTPIHFPSQQPSVVPTLPHLEIKPRNILTFRLVAQTITKVEFHQLL